jgi:two-component system sensor histidine kinase PilS (NtrC family)
VPIHSSQAKKPAPLHFSSGITAYDYADQYWGPLFYFNIYRLIAGSSLLIITWQFHFTSFGSYHHLLFIYTNLSYILFSSISILFIKLRHPDFNWQLAIQVIGDTMFLSVMLYASGGLQSGLGGLLLVSLAGAGLISRGRMAIFFASIATISLLLQETYPLLTTDSYVPQYSQAGLLSMAYFAVAWLAQQLAKHTLASEQLALERGVDLANMAQVNQLVIQDLQEGILVVDRHGNIRQRNTYAEKLLNLETSANSTEFLKLFDQAPEIANRLIAWQNDSNTNFELLRLDHGNTLIRTRFLPIQSDFRNGVVIFLEDMGRIQAQLQQLKLAALGRLTANIAHEIRNPLSAISHAAELLEEEQLGGNTDSRLLRIICDNTKRLNKIVQDVLQLNRRNISKLEVINANEFIYKFLEGFCHTENIDPNVFLLNSSKNYLINFDRDHLNQIVWNLCRNAWRHCRKQVHSIRIELSNETSQNDVYLDIMDDGPGVEPQQIKQIFEPFFTTAASGTGLGLYIARELCEANQASLECIEGSSGGHLRIICKDSQSYL